ncbi:MAG: glutathione S-transferase family protein [Hyphomicrobiales bacterium]
MPHLYAMPGSGNSYKVQLLAALIGIKLDQTNMSALDGSTKSETYLQKNAIGKLPLLQLDDGRYLPESGAILNFLAEGTDFLSSDRYQRALCLSWMFFEQYSHEPTIAVSRSINLYPERAAGITEEFKQSLFEKGNIALGVMETQLAKTPYLVGELPTIADIALYAYTHDCHQGGFNLERFPGISAWINRIASLPRYMTMPSGNHQKK